MDRWEIPVDHYFVSDSEMSIKTKLFPFREKYHKSGIQFVYLITCYQKEDVLPVRRRRK